MNPSLQGFKPYNKLNASYDFKLIWSAEEGTAFEAVNVWGQQAAWQAECQAMNQAVAHVQWAGSKQ